MSELGQNRKLRALRTCPVCPSKADIESSYADQGNEQVCSRVLGPILNQPTFPARPPAPISNVRTKGRAAAGIRRAACSPQGTRRRTGLIRATPLSADPQSAAWRLIARPERSTPIL